MLTELDAAAVEGMIHQALIEACNEELGRRREVEAARDRAMRIQSALEGRNCQLEGWLEGINSNIMGIERALLQGNGYIDMKLLRDVRKILNEFLCEEPTV
jgi:hypothetical protein